MHLSPRPAFSGNVGRKTSKNVLNGRRRRRMPIQHYELTQGMKSNETGETEESGSTIKVQ